MTPKSCNSIFHRIQYQVPSISPPTLTVFQKMLNGSSVSRKKLPSPIVVKVAEPPLNRIEKETGFQSSKSRLGRAVLYSDHTEESEKTNDGRVQLEDMWKEIQGSHHSKGMLDPIHALLLSDIIRYGVFARATYEAFHWKPRSKYDGRCKYGRKTLVAQLGLERCGYQLTKYIYAATADIDVPEFLKRKLEAGDRCNWIGYVAVSQDEKEIKRLGRRDIVIALRGTATYMEWLVNFMHSLTPARLNPLDPRKDVKVEMGFLSLYTSLDCAREQLLSDITGVVKKYKGEELSITITGPSVGGALATLCAYDIAELEINCVGSECCSIIPITF